MVWYGSMAGSTDSAFKESGVWNVANKYSEDIIFFHAWWVDRSRMMAQLGCLDPLEDVNLPPETKLNYRMTGLNHFYLNLDLLISSSKFAIRNPGLNKKIQQLHDDIKQVKKCMELIETKMIDDKTHKSHVEINIQLFEQCYLEMVRIHESLLPILYKENLIYQYVKQYSQKERKEDIMKKLVDGRGG